MALKERVAQPSTYLHWLLLVLGVLLYTLSFPSVLHTHGTPWLGFFALAPIIYLSYYISFRQALWYSLWFGALFACSFAWWTQSYFLPALFGAAIITALSFLPMLPLLQYISKRSKWAPLVHAIGWVAFEYMRIQGVFGNPFALLGYSQFRSPEIVQLATYTGVWGVSLLVVVPSALLAGYMQTARTLSRRASVLMGVLWVLIFAGLFISWSFRNTQDTYQPTEKSISVAIIQHNPPLASKEQEVERLLQLSTAALKESPHIIVWPEAVVEMVVRDSVQEQNNLLPLQGASEGRAKAIMQSIKDFQTESGVPLLFGAYDYDSSADKLYNAALLMAHGKLQDSWYKQKLVPFIEYSPVGWLPFANKALQRLSFGLLSPGSSMNPMVVELGFGESVAIATPICFEESFGSLVRSQINHGAEYLINITNDSWANGEYAQWQHFAMGVFRAVEQQSPLVRVASSGVSGLIRPTGQWQGAVLDPLVAGYMVVHLEPVSSEPTLYGRWGDWFAWLCIGVVLLIYMGGFLLRGSL